MQRRTRIALSCACGVLAVAASLAYGGSVRAQAQRDRAQALERYGGEVVSLVVSSRAMEAGEVVAATDVSSRDWLSSLAPAGAVTDMADAVGREVTVPVAEGAPLTALNFRDASQIADIPAGHVAVSVPITDKLGVSAAVRVGAHVTAYRTLESATEVICSSAIVLAVPGNTGAMATRGSLTIAVPAKDVSGVLYASTSGDLRLVVPAEDVRQAPQDGERSGKDVPPAQKDGQGAGDGQGKEDGKDE
ncbi:MAG: Flp pilus assembly protein CpaB [Coriobacteriales bacterium]|nr:Flp pilus assembly protein CpaB [Coriobacteriales bacterium]